MKNEIDLLHLWYEDECLESNIVFSLFLLDQFSHLRKVESMFP
jgi:hypothetical protein